MRTTARGHSEGRPLGLTLIAGFYLFGATAMLVSMVTNPSGVGSAIAERHGLPLVAAPWALPAIAALAALIALGLLRQARWGLWLTVTYLLWFGAVSAWAALSGAGQPFPGNLIWSLLVLAYLWSVRAVFLRARSA